MFCLVVLSVVCLLLEQRELKGVGRRTDALLSFERSRAVDDSQSEHLALNDAA